MLSCPTGSGPFLPTSPAVEKSEREGAIPACFSNVFNGHTQASHHSRDLSMKIVGLTMWLHGRAYYPSRTLLVLLARWAAHLDGLSALNLPLALCRQSQINGVLLARTKGAGNEQQVLQSQSQHEQQ